MTHDSEDRLKNNIPINELQSRWQRCRTLLRQYMPEAGGLLVFSRLNIYYFTGTFGNGIFWLPPEGRPVFFCRKALERARLESPLDRILPFRSYADILKTFQDTGAPMPPIVAAEMNGLSWALGEALARHFSNHRFLSADRVIARVRAKKSEWELEKMRFAGSRHDKCLQQLLPKVLRVNMTERQVGLALWRILLEEGHQGLLRMENYGEEVFFGHISAGDSGNYPSVFNGPLGLRGEHPAVPHMGSSAKIWRTAEPLACDVGFMFEGYQTDKTQIYWSGNPAGIPAKVRAAHDFCIETQEWVRANLRPGALPSELAAHCFERAKSRGWSEGFMALGDNKVKFIGHGIGLAIDEYPVLAKGFDAPLEEGGVMAVEPKIGIPGLGMVGVENTFEITRNGGRSLTGEAYDIICIHG
jgi:Xaa-Pro aminopeptidase